MLDRTIAPAYNQSTAFELISPDTRKLPNGVDIFFIHGGFQEVLKIELIFPAGRWTESIDGASYFTSHLLTKGTIKRSSFEIAQQFDLFGAHVEINPGLDFVSISLYSLTKKLQPVLELLMEIITEATFPEKEIEQAKSIYIQNLRVNLEKTSFLASKLFRRSLFGDAHPYGKELEESQVNALNQPALQEHFTKFFRNVSVFVSGKIDEHNEELIVRTFAGFRVEKSNSQRSDISPPVPKNIYQEKEKSVQSSIRVGGLSVMRKDPGYVDAVFVSHILGGYFGSRLMKNIREEKGLTYGVYASIHPLQHGSYFVIGADVNKENINITFDEVRKELKKLREETISDTELRTAKNHFIGSLQSEITTPFAHADKIKTIYLFGLPSDYYRNLISTIKDFTPGKIRETSEKFFDENNFYQIAVG